MYFTEHTELPRSRDMMTQFGGYNHKLSCADGEFFDMENMTSAYFPILSPRNKRGICLDMKNPQGIIDKEVLMWVDAGKLYQNGVECDLAGGVSIGKEGTKTLAKMGAYVVVMPDKVWYNVDDGTSGKMEASYETFECSFSVCSQNGTKVTWHNEAYYEVNTPKNGDYCMTRNDGKAVLKEWSSTNSMWLTVTSTYVQIIADGIGSAFKKGDGVKMYVDNADAQWEYANKLFINVEEEDFYSLNTVITDCGDNFITFVGLIDEHKEFENLHLTVRREVPSMAFITECGNRLWGCSYDGHEVYCCKLGDVTNWNCFEGISTDSWAATIGSDGKFTGAITYLGYPTFFKENSILKIAVSSTGAHQTKESYCRGVQRGSERSLCILNEVLFYKGTTDVCAYDGSLPQSISSSLGEVRYSDAVSGTIGNRYYISMKDDKGNYHLFVYDYDKGIWTREDDTNALYFCTNKDELYYIDNVDKKLKSVRGTLPFEKQETEGDFKWFAESGTIGYATPDNKYVSKISLRLSMEVGTNVDFYLQYDSSGEWEHKFNMSGKGTKAFTVPVIPRRCDHFKYKIVGRGTCKIYSISKTIEEGSDI